MEVTKSILQREYVQCAVCGSDDTRTVYQIPLQSRTLSTVWVDGARIDLDDVETLVACNVCNLCYVNPRWAWQPSMITYSTEHELDYFGRTYDTRRWAYGNLMRRVPHWLGREARMLLDVGCGDGALLEAAQQAGIQAVGVETSGVLVRLVRQRLGDQAIVGDDVLDLPAEHYDVITLINVIEHLREPRAMLLSLARLLTVDGILLIHAPNMGGIPARVHGVNWHQIEPLEHLYYFTARTLGALLRHTGFEPAARFNISVSRDWRGGTQQLLGHLGIYLDSGLGIMARRSR